MLQKLKLLNDNAFLSERDRSCEYWQQRNWDQFHYMIWWFIIWSGLCWNIHINVKCGRCLSRCAAQMHAKCQSNWTSLNTKFVFSTRWFITMSCFMSYWNGLGALHQSSTNYWGTLKTALHSDKSFWLRIALLASFYQLITQSWKISWSNTEPNHFTSMYNCKFLHAIEK